MMNPIREPNTLEVGFKTVPTHGVLVPIETCVNVLKEIPHTKIVAIVLIVHDVATA